MISVLIGCCDALQDVKDYLAEHNRPVKSFYEQFQEREQHAQRQKEV